MSVLPVVVIGGGPAGCAAAFALARSGINALVLERGARGRDKPCGDALVPETVAQLAALGLDGSALESLGGYPFEAIDLSSATRLIWRLTLGGRGYMLRRSALDQVLRDGVAHVAYEWRALSLSYTHGAWNVDGGRAGRLRALAVILACGAGSPLQATLGVDGEPIASASMSTYVTRDAPTDLVFDFAQDNHPGYCWVFPTASGVVNAGICRLGGRPNLAGMRQAADNYVRALGVARDSRWRGGAGPCWSGVAKQWHDRRGLVSCGDAAALIDPLTGEGIGAALKSGRWAGEALAAYLDHGANDATALETYTERVRMHFAESYRATSLRRIWSGLCGL